MQLNEIIEENTLPSISSKTRLSVENLEKLFEQDFSGFRKVQALGFISILEREYRADLSEVRAACHAYFSDSTASEVTKAPETSSNPPKRSSSVSDVPMPKKWPSFVKPLMVGVVAIGLLYAAWQTYSTGMEETNASRTGEDVGFFASIIHQATSWMGGEETPGALDIGSVKGTDALDNKDANVSDNTFVIEKTQAENHTQTTESTSKEENDILQKVKEEQAKKLEAQRQSALDAEIQKTDEALASAVEENESTETPLSTEVPSIVKGTQPPIEKTAQAEPQLSAEAAAAKQKADEAAARLKAEKEAAQQKAIEAQALREREARQKAAEEKAIRARAAREKAAKDKIAREKAAKAKAAKAKAARAKVVILKPRKKAWLGIVNLTNMKRRVATSRATQTFDTNKGKWIVATGHGYIDYDEGLAKKKLNDGKKHFLLIEKGNVKEISHEEFQRLNKSKVW